MPTLGRFCFVTITCECILSLNNMFFIIVYFMKTHTDIHCVEIAVLRKLGDFEVFCNYFSFVCFNNLFENIFNPFNDITR
jgi:hypothetical protein